MGEAQGLDRVPRCPLRRGHGAQGGCSSARPRRRSSTGLRARRRWQRRSRTRNAARISGSAGGGPPSGARLARAQPRRDDARAGRRGPPAARCASTRSATRNAHAARASFSSSVSARGVEVDAPGLAGRSAASAKATQQAAGLVRRVVDAPAPPPVEAGQQRRSRRSAASAAPRHVRRAGSAARQRPDVDDGHDQREAPAETSVRRVQQRSARQDHGRHAVGRGGRAPAGLTATAASP